MPPLFIDTLPDGSRVAAWAAREPVEALLAELPTTWRGRLPTFPARLRETLAARRALLAVAPEHAGSEIGKDSFGKPFLVGAAGLHVSLSHSHGHGAALVSQAACGIDLQLRVEKIVRLRSKFESDRERASIARQPDETAALHVLFSAKEALFKLWGRRQIDWREHLRVEPFDHVGLAGEARGVICKDGHTVHARLYWRWIGDFCLVAALGE